MGRSQPTTTDKINRLSGQLHNFRRALMSRREQLAFDQLMGIAKNNRLAISQVEEMLPIDAVQMTMLIHLACQVEELKEAVERWGDDAVGR
ncbi:MAG: hypothetical protein AAF633_03810 [Chloroflexota bacterium]